MAGRYELDGDLGRGGMAEVRAGTDRRLQRPVAVKFLLPAMAARDDIRRRFEAEACAAASFSDPHAVAVYDTGEHEGVPYIVMERLPGETLADRIAAGPVDPAWLRLVAVEVLGALGAAHATGLVHRDVKPGNILITADDHAKIADFGIAKSLESAGSLDLTGTGQLLGTPAYLAPERLDGAPSTVQSDLYSLGVVMYEALAGTCPFAGETPLAIARAVAAGDFPPLDHVRPGLDPDLVATVERAMATDPTHRFDSAAAMAAALTAADEPTMVGLVGAAPTEELDRRDLVDTKVAAPLPAAGPPRRRSRLPIALLVGLVLVGLLVAVLNRPDAKEPAATAGGSTVGAATSGAALAADLRAVAGRLGPSDGERADDMAAALRNVADQVEGGGGGAAATAAIVSAGAWRATGQLSDAAAAAAIDVLRRVPGASVVTVPPGGATTPAAPSVSVNSGSGNAGSGTTAGNAGSGKGDKDDDKGKGKGKDD